MVASAEAWVKPVAFWRLRQDVWGGSRFRGRGDGSRAQGEPIVFSYRLRTMQVAESTRGASDETVVKIVRLSEKSSRPADRT